MKILLDETELVNEIFEIEFMPINLLEEISLRKKSKQKSAYCCIGLNEASYERLISFFQRESSTMVENFLELVHRS